MSDNANGKKPPTSLPPPHPFSRRVPEGDNRERLICDDCGFVSYENPKIVVGSVCTWGEKVLLAKRAIHPRKGYWTLPAGFMEMHESTEDGAIREALEEACARIEIVNLLAVYSIPRIGQVQIMYTARLLGDDIAAGPESEAVGLYDWADIPWDNLAFPSVVWALRHFQQVRHLPSFVPFANPPDDSVSR